MNNSISITIRISPKLKKDAEVACEYLDKTMSAFLRNCLVDLVRGHHKTQAMNTAYERQFMEGDNAKLAFDALGREMKVFREKHDLPDDIPVTYTVGENGTYVLTPPKTRDIRFDQHGHIDASTMSRKQRRAYDRDQKKGVFAEKPLTKAQESTLTDFDPEQRLKELLDKEKKSFLTRQERDQKNALIRAGV